MLTTTNAWREPQHADCLKTLSAARRPPSIRTDSPLRNVVSWMAESSSASRSLVLARASFASACDRLSPFPRSADSWPFKPFKLVELVIFATWVRSVVRRLCLAFWPRSPDVTELISCRSVSFRGGLPSFTQAQHTEHCVTVELLRFLISDLCSPGTFPWSPQRSSGTLTMSNGVFGFSSWTCCSNSSQCLVWRHTRNVLVIDRSFSNHTLIVLGANDVCRHSLLPILIKRYAHSSEFNIPDSSGTVGRSQVCADDGMYPKGRTPTLPMLRSNCCFSPSWLLSSPVALFASSPSRCDSRCLCQFLGWGPLFTCRLFSG